jgi:hypothetical protein
MALHVICARRQEAVVVCGVGQGVLIHGGVDGRYPPVLVHEAEGLGVHVARFDRRVQVVLDVQVRSTGEEDKVDVKVVVKSLLYV